MSDDPRKPPRSADASAVPAPIDHRQHGLQDGLVGLRQLIDRLLDPVAGCPWDRAQTLDSLRPYLLEEAWEVWAAMDDAHEHRDELGDLLFQIVFQSALRERAGDFDLDGVIEAIRSKLIRRHPHVFRDPSAQADEALPADPEEVARAWARIKAEERARRGTPALLVPRGLPPLARARKLQSLAAEHGFDWPDLGGVLDKIDEEVSELRAAAEDEANERTRIREELGDLLFVLVRLSQRVGVDVEEAVASANDKFDRRFRSVLSACQQAGIRPQDAGLERLEAYWQAAKTPQATDRAELDGDRLHGPAALASPAPGEGGAD